MISNRNRNRCVGNVPDDTNYKVSFLQLSITGASNGLSVPVHLHNCKGFGNNTFYTVQENLQGTRLNAYEFS